VGAAIPIAFVYKTGKIWEWIMKTLKERWERRWNQVDTTSSFGSISSVAAVDLRA